MPVSGWWMDPVALYRGRLPVDSKSLKALPEAEKEIPIPVPADAGALVPAGTRPIRPYTCSRRK